MAVCNNMQNDESQKVIAVVGATGQQGGAVVRGLLKQNQFKIRALTRNPTGKKGAALKKLGCDVVKANLDDTASLKEAFQGAYGVYAVTNFWQTMKAETEVAQAKNIAAAAASAKISHLIWSTLEDTRETLKGAKTIGGYTVIHFDAKWEINKVFADAKVPSTNAVSSFYMENYLTMMPPTDYGHGYVVGLNMGDVPLTMMALDDWGNFCAGIFANPDYIGKTVGIASDQKTGKEIAAIFAKHKKETINYYEMTDEEMEKSAGLEMANMFMYWRKGIKKCTELRVEGPKLCKLTSFEDWVKANADKVVLKQATAE